MYTDRTEKNLAVLPSSIALTTTVWQKEHFTIKISVEVSCIIILLWNLYFRFVWVAYFINCCSVIKIFKKSLKILKFKISIYVFTGCPWPRSFSIKCNLFAACWPWPGLFRSFLLFTFEKGQEANPESWNVRSTFDHRAFDNTATRCKPLVEMQSITQIKITEYQINENGQKKKNWLD